MTTTIPPQIKGIGWEIIDVSECLSSINPGKSMLTPGLPFSEKQISDEDSVRFLPD